MTQLSVRPTSGGVPIRSAWDAVASVLQEAGMQLLRAGGPGAVDAAEEVRVHVERWYRLEGEFDSLPLVVPDSVISGLRELEEQMSHARVPEVVSFLGLLASLTAAFSRVVGDRPGFAGSSFERQLRMLVRSADLVHESVVAYLPADGPGRL
ncbi:hypothetical protein AB3K78_01320 [Leucobacter sp. HNU]|uniref:hypothetical protein n=1 Tax=Leucobacter sp. HNU TaxID=3236805 RepID=UPI003A7FA89C